MRTFRIEEAVAFCGLGRTRIERLVADPRFPAYGTGDTLLAADLFDLALAGALHRLGLSWPAVRGLVAGLGRCALDPGTGVPVEVFPGQRRVDFAPCLFVLRASAGGPVATLVSPDQLWAGIAAYGTAIGLVVDASALAERIAALPEPASTPAALV